MPFSTRSNEFFIDESGRVESLLIPMSWKQYLHVIYGLTMGTSVPYYKSKKRPLLPAHVERLNDFLRIYIGGAGNCGFVQVENKIILINSNRGAASEHMLQFIQPESVTEIICTSWGEDYMGGLPLFPKAQVSLPQAEHQNTQFKLVSVKEILNLGLEQIEIIPVKKALYSCELVLKFKKSNVIFLGGLFYNQIHPPILADSSAEVWIQTLEDMLRHADSETIFVPHEGQLAKRQDLAQFIEYLRCLSSEKIPFRHLRENFDWAEVPGYTSLEENFEILRKKQ